MSQLPVPAELAPDLKRVDQIIAERTTARPVVAGIAGPHLGAGAGRWRAVVALLAARLGAYAPERAAHAAAAVELIYAAARVHDSLVDEAARRRGQMAAQAHWGSSAALMVGDYLFALAAAEMALAPDPRVIAAYSRSVMAICEGQLAPVTSVVPLDVARNQYLYRAGRIDAALFEAAARAGAACSELAPEQADALGRFGYDLGLALRIAADARDYEGPGAALRAGVITLPLIYAVDAGGARLAEVLDSRVDEPRLQEALAEVRRRGGVERAHAEARACAERAAAQLTGLPDGPALEALRALAAAAAGS